MGRDEGMEEGREEKKGRKGGRKEGEEEGRGGGREEGRGGGREGEYALRGVVWCARSSPLVVLLLGTRHSMVVGTRCCLVVVLGCSSWPWAVVAVADSVSWALHRRCGRSRSWVGVHVHGRLVVVGGLHVREWLVVVVGVMSFVVRASCRGRLSPFVFVGGCWWLWACTFGGDWWSLWACTFASGCC